jgi:CelD/BcsL family acetyltransferase involved in cellulose biosynthesis
LEIRTLTNLIDFETLKDNWDNIYNRDDKATIFQSWSWLRGWIEKFPGDWFIIAIRSDNDSDYIAFFPLFREIVTGRLGLRTHQILRLAGEPLADYTGLLCLPEYENDVIVIITTYLLKDVRWYKFRFREVADPRLLEIVRRINVKRYSIRYIKNTPCPQLILPNSWEQYIHDVLEPKFSKKFTSKMHKAEKKGCYTSKVDNDKIEFYIDYFLNLFEMKWGKLDISLKELYKSTFLWSYYANNLQINLLWYESHPIAIQVSFIDKKRKMFHYYNGGWNPMFSNLSPGIVLHGHCIKTAIENGFKVYDFMRGGEEYKYLFGAVNRYNKNIIITQNTIEKNIRKLINRVVTYVRPV